MRTMEMTGPRWDRRRGLVPKRSGSPSLGRKKWSQRGERWVERRAMKEYLKRQAEREGWRRQQEANEPVHRSPRRVCLVQQPRTTAGDPRWSRWSSLRARSGRGEKAQADTLSRPRLATLLRPLLHTNVPVSRPSWSRKSETPVRNFLGLPLVGPPHPPLPSKDLPRPSIIIRFLLRTLCLIVLLLAGNPPLLVIRLLLVLLVIIVLLARKSVWLLSNVNLGPNLRIESLFKIPSPMSLAFPPFFFFSRAV
jgi:hypothetical protein